MAKKSAANSVPDERRAHPTEVVPLASLKPHPRNYKRHPPEQIEHLCASLRQYGQFRNVVVARDSTILAGHGVVQAMAKLGWTEATVVRLDLDPKSTKALKLVALDNELPKFAETDDRMLVELLREVASSGGADALIGTGFDEDGVSLLLAETHPGEGAPPKTSLASRFGVPPFSVFNAREGWWQARKAAWLALGIKSELGRDREEKAVADSASPGGSRRPLDRPAYAEQLRRSRGSSSPGEGIRPAMKIRGSVIERGDGAGKPLKKVDTRGKVP